MRLKPLTIGLFIVLVGSISVMAQEGSLVPNKLNKVEIDKIISDVTKNEESFRSALTNYVFTRKATMQTIGIGGNITGTYRRDSFMTFTDSGKRFEKVLFAPISTLTELQITREDLEDLGGVNPFAVNPRKVNRYSFTYIGKQKIDELNLHVFDVRPRKLPKKVSDRLFYGRIWVDDRDRMIVKSKGKGVPEGKQRFPIVETWRTNVDGKYWFPAYSYADEELVFDSGQVVRLRMKVTYEEYKRTRSDVIVLDDDVEVIDEPTERKEGAPPPLPKPKP